jgi:hypothetical protein
MLSGMHHHDSGLVVAGVVVADRAGGCDPVYVVTAAENWSAATKRLRAAGYKRIDSRPGRMKLGLADVTIAVQKPGSVFERPRSADGPWQDITGSAHPVDDS